jgi:signal transduction histidine kinase
LPVLGKDGTVHKTVRIAVGATAAAAALASRAALRRLRRQNARLREVDALKDDLISLVSHELRTPLTSIIGYVELVLDARVGAGSLTEQQRHFLEIAARNGHRLEHVVSDLLLVAQADAGKLVLEPRPTQLEEVVHGSVEAIRPRAEAKQVALSVAAGEVPEIEADPARLGQLVDNLLSNAVKFTPEGGSVNVRIAAENGWVAVEVADTGIGITAEQQERLFERFFRTAEASDLAIPGTGLGLSIVRAIAQAHGGEVTVASTAGVGTTFRLELPV